MKNQTSKYFSGMSPKRGFTTKFKELDNDLRMLNRELTHYIIAYQAGNKQASVEQDRIRAEMDTKLIELKKIAKDCTFE